MEPDGDIPISLPDSSHRFESVRGVLLGLVSLFGAIENFSKVREHLDDCFIGVGTSSLVDLHKLKMSVLSNRLGAKAFPDRNGLM